MRVRLLAGALSCLSGLAGIRRTGAANLLSFGQPFVQTADSADICARALNLRKRSFVGSEIYTLCGRIGCYSLLAQFGTLFYEIPKIPLKSRDQPLVFEGGAVPGQVGFEIQF